MSDEDLAAWVAASCARHGVPVKVTDSAVVARVSVLLGAGVPASRPLRALSLCSEPPDRIDPVGVEFPGSLRAWGDHRVIEHSTDNGVLAGQVEIRPLSA